MTPVRLFVSLVLVSALGACSSSPRQAGAPEPGFSSSVAGTSARAQSDGASSSSSGPSQARGGHAFSSTGPSASPSNAGLPYGVQGRPNDNQPWECQFRRGDHCKVPFAGSYYLFDRPEANIVFKAFENGSNAAASTSSPLPAPHGAAPFNAVFPYTVGLTAKTVIFQVFLLDDKGKVLASGKPHAYPVTGV